MADTLQSQSPVSAGAAVAESEFKLSPTQQAALDELESLAAGCAHLRYVREEARETLPKKVRR